MSSSDAIVGRSAELERIDRFLDAVATGPRGLLLEGAAGIGKSTLWRAASERAQARGYVVLSSRAAESEARLSLTALGDVLDPAFDRLAPGLPEPQRLALEVALLRRPSQRLTPDQRAVSVATLSALRLLSTEAPVLLSFDDIQWMDPSSARVLSFAFRRLSDEPLGVVAARRLGSGAAEPLELDRAFEGNLWRVPVPPLDPVGIRGVLTQLGLDLPHPVLRRVHETSGGNPFFALELARVLPAEIAPGEPLPVPDDVEELLGTRLRSFPEPTRILLATVAAAASPTVAQLRDAWARDVEAALQEAGDAGLLHLQDGRLRFAHPLMAAAAYAATTPEELRDIHRRLAGAVEDGEERARHLALSASGPDAEVAAALDEAATSAASRAAPETAAALSELAWRLTPRDTISDIARRRVKTAEFLFDSGDETRALELLQEAIENATSGHERATVRYLYATLIWQDLASIEPMLIDALTEAGGDQVLLTAIHLDLAWLRIYQGDLPDAVSHSDTCLEASAELAEELRSDALALRSVVRFLTGEMGGGRVREVLQLRHTQPLGTSWERGLPSVYTTPADVMGLLMMWAGDLDEARQILQEELDGYSDRLSIAVRAEPLHYLAEIEDRSGRWDEARSHGSEALDIGTESGHARGLGLAHLALTFAEAMRGDAGRARRHGEDGLQRCLQNQDPFYEAACRHALGFLELSLGDPAAAHAHLEPAVAFLERLGSPEPGVIPCLPDEIESLVALGQIERADELTTRLEEQGASQERRWAVATGARCRGLVLATRGDLDGASEALSRAVKEHSAVPQPFELGRTLLVRGSIERRAKRKREARASIEEALEIFEHLGTAPWADRARAELDRVGGRATGLDALTPTERRVAGLAVDGKTNKEIADEMFISVKTVEANMSRVLRKLRIGSRREISDRLGGARPGED